MNKIIFLGTGNSFNYHQQQTSISFVTDKINFLIDCGDGMGTLRNLNQAGIKLESVNDIFITHKHADHISGLPFILLNKILRESTKIRIFGPGQALKTAKDICLKTGFLPPDNHRVAFIPIKSKQIVKLGKNISVSGFRMKDIPGRNVVEYAYEVTIGGKRIVFPADTNSNKAFDKFALKTDIMIHECAGLDENRESINPNGHSTARDAGECAVKAKVKQLILTHLPESTKAKAADLVNEARHYFGGKVTAAEDLMEITF